MELSNLKSTKLLFTPAKTTQHDTVSPLTVLTLRRSFYLGLIICLVGLLPFLIQKGLANAYHFKSRYYINQWQSGKAVEPLQYANALLASDYAVSFDNTNPHYLLTQAKVLEWGVYAKLTIANSEKFNQLYRQAITLRTVWPNAYSDYAYNLAFVQNDLVKAWSYLLQAATYGPYSPEVLRQTLAIGMTRWGELDVSQKQYVLQTALVVAQSDWKMRNELSLLVNNNHLAKPVCRYIKYQKQQVDDNTINWLNNNICRDYKMIGARA